ncbi:lipase/acyltransferase domain-containing protein [Streptomyces sp. NBC_00868]|uniref:lipase/acyltransferase domain-containing protein n=1 Tax=Streptomyces sp. NBC_00868 TaxID=2903683 RepID=UPI002F911AF0
MTDQAQGYSPNPSPGLEPQLVPAVTHDAVVVVPGIMGSELYDTSRNEVIWGLANSRWLTRAWLTRSGLDSLRLTPDELAGEHGRVRARRLLETAAWSPFFKGFEPYHKLLNTIESTVAHHSAILTFPYDWRLPVSAHARTLAAAARDHLTRWRSHPAQIAARAHAVDDREARLVFIAHSMGGLVTYAALNLGGDHDLTDDTRGVMTLGTPFQGSVVAANILNTLQGAPLPLPHNRLATAAATMPGVHDLLPRFLCLEDGPTVRTLTPADVADLGGDKELFAASQNFFGDLYRQPLPHHRPIAGIGQETVQSLQLHAGVVHASEYCFREDSNGELKRDKHGRPLRYPVKGDGTVHRVSASPVRRAMPIHAQHGALASGKQALRTVADFLLEDDHLGPDQADDGLGLNVPDYVHPHTKWDIAITGTDDATGIECTISAVDSDYTRSARVHADGDDRLRATLTVPDTGLYRVTVRSDHSHTLTQLVFAGPDGTEYLDE